MADNTDRRGDAYLREQENDQRQEREESRSPLERFFGFSEPSKTREREPSEKGRREERSRRERETGMPMERQETGALERTFGMAFPAMNISQTDTDVRVTLDVEGIDANNINVEVADDWMAINGWIESVSTDENRPGSYERMFRAFRREVILPTSVREDDVEATYDGRRLSVIAPKASRSSQRRVRVERLNPYREEEA